MRAGNEHAPAADECRSVLHELEEWIDRRLTKQVDDDMAREQRRGVR